MQSKPEIRIRLADSADAPSIASVLHQSFVEYRSSYTPEGFAATVLTIDKIEARLRLNEGPVWVALCEEAIIGTVSAVPKGESVYVRSMAVLPAARGLGVGELLLKQIESYALASGYQGIVLNTTPFLRRAIRLYEHFGFRRCDESAHDLFGTPLFTMRRSLMLEVLLKRFENPDEVRLFEKGKFEIIKIAGMTIGKATYEPGWRWSEHVSRTAGTPLCEVEHIGMVISGTATAAMKDGEIYELVPGTVFYIPPIPHDSWVVGDDPYVSLHFLGANQYAGTNEEINS
ncbi:MAG: GNAT family N-acetyltransferase [Acidobacteria bacterium]|nr:GNAT family N-acetyltransferase [Acidobacteriota bacterium]